MGDSPNPFGMMFTAPLKIAKFVVVAFAGAISNIPAGWYLCDGTHATPDLRDKFIVATGPIFSVGSEGGASPHSHDFTSDGHQHLVESGTDILMGPNIYGQSHTSVFQGTTDNAANMPPYYALAYIMYRGD